MNIKTNIVRTSYFLSDVFGIILAITAYAPGALIDLIVPWPNNRWRCYIVIIIGMLILAPVNILLFCLEHGLRILADQFKLDNSNEF